MNNNFPLKLHDRLKKRASVEHSKGDDISGLRASIFTEIADDVMSAWSDAREEAADFYAVV